MDSALTSAMPGMPGRINMVVNQVTCERPLWSLGSPAGSLLAPPTGHWRRRRELSLSVGGAGESL